MPRERLVCLALFAAAAALLACWGAAAEPRSSGRVRHPVAAALLRDGRTLCVANRRGGSISLVDLRAGRVRAEVAVGGTLAGLAVLPDRAHVLTVDEEQHQLVALESAGETLRVRARLAVGLYPVSVAVSADGRRATVACLWSRRVDVVDLTPLAAPGPVTLQLLHTVTVPFAPRVQCVLPGGAHVVADAFGGRLAVLDPQAGRVRAVRAVEGHNISGLAVAADGKHLLLSHQILNQQAATTLQNITRGVLMANVLRSIPLDRLTTADGGQLIPLDTTAAGAGDPAGVLVDGERVAVALSGVDAVALLGNGGDVRRVTVGRRPTEVVRAKEMLVVVNTLDDSLSLLDANRAAVTATVALGSRPEPDDRERGERLFFDARLSPHGMLSCHSCHTDSHTNGLLADTQEDGTFGTPKRTPTLRNTAATGLWGWTGRFQYLHDQVRTSVEGTLAAPATWRQTDDLVSFLATLPPPPPPEPVTAADREQVERGRRIFQANGCSRCHVGPRTYTSVGTHEVGFTDERGERRFNAPSLRGVGQNDRFLHDGRAAVLEEVFTKFRHKLPADTPPDERDDLLRFLRSL